MSDDPESHSPKPHKRHKKAATAAATTAPYPMTSVNDCQVRDETLGLDDVYWIRTNEGEYPARVGEIWRTAHDDCRITVAWFTKSAPPQWKLADNEYVLTEDSTTVTIENIANKAPCLDWDAYNPVGVDTSQYLFYRITEINDGDDDDPDCYQWACAEENHDTSREDPDLSLPERLICACGCKEHLAIDEGYTYCHHCKRSVQDDHLSIGTESEEAVLVKAGKVVLLNGHTGEEKVALCAACKAPFEDTSIAEVRPASTEDHRTTTIICDIGTRTVRMLLRYGEGKEYFTEYDSSAFVPRGSQTPIALGKSAIGLEGDFVYPLKRLVKPDEATKLVLSKLDQCGSKMFADLLQDALDERVADVARDVAGQSNMLMLQSGDVVVATAFPCCFDSEERSSYLRAFRGHYPEARIVAIPEPVAAIYALLDSHELGTDAYIVIDVGATTIDGAVVSVTKEGLRDSKISVLSTFGSDIGADLAELKTARVFMDKASEKNLSECLEAVRAYGDDIKNGDLSVPSTRRGIDIRSTYLKHLDEFYEQVKIHFESEGVQNAIAQAPANPNILLCGGGARSSTLCGIAESVFRGMPIKMFEASPNYARPFTWLHAPADSCRYSQALNGCIQKLDPKHNLVCSPATICLECDREKPGTELMIIVQKGQALEHAKLPSAQLKPGQLIILDTQLGTTDAKLTVKGCYDRAVATVNSKGLLVVDPDAKQLFYTVCTIHFSKKEWRAETKGPKKRPKRALTLVSIHVDVNGGVVLCDALLIKHPGTIALVEELERMSIQEVKEKYAATSQITLAGSLNLHEIDPRERCIRG